MEAPADFDVAAAEIDGPDFSRLDVLQERLLGDAKPSGCLIWGENVIHSGTPRAKRTRVSTVLTLTTTAACW